MNPTDYEILQVLADGRRQHRANLSRIVDKDSDYISERLSSLTNTGDIRHVGPAPRSGLYEITPTGRAILRDADTPAENEVTQAPPETPHLSPVGFTVLSRIHYADEPPTLPEIVRRTDYDTSFITAILDGLQYQQLIDTLLVRITKSYADMSTQSTVEAFHLTDRGKAVLDHRDTWIASGDPGLADAITND